MKVRKIPMRTCVVTKEQLPKRQLLRIVRDKEENVSIDTIGKANGRGAYIKKSLEVLQQAKKSKILEKKLECPIDDQLYNEIEKIIIQEVGGEEK